MEILFDHQIFSRQQVGGISRYFINLANTLSRRGDVSVQLEQGMFVDDAGYLGLTLQPGIVRFALAEALIRSGLQSRKAWDVHHATYYLSSRRRSRAYVVTHHDCTLERYPEMFKAAKVHIRLKARQYQEADRIIAISSHSSEDLQEFYGIDPSKITRVYHGVESPGAGTCASLPAVLAGRPFILFLGARPPYKNFLRLLEAYAQSRVHKDFLLVAAGGGPLSPPEQERVTSLGLQNHLVSLPRVSDPVLNTLFRGASLFVYPSLYEGFGFPPLEAMLANCPVAASRASSIPEICQDAALYFDPYSTESIAMSLESLFDTKVLEVLRTRGQVVAPSYSWSRCAEETLKVYQSLV